MLPTGADPDSPTDARRGTPRTDTPRTGTLHTDTAPGLWTTPVRGRVAVSALAWVLAYGLGLVVVVVLGMFAMQQAGTSGPDVAVLALVLVTGTALAALIAVRVHLLRRRGLGWADVGLRRPDRSPLHLLWQIPAVLIAGILASVYVLLPLGVEQAGESGDAAISDLVSGGPLLAALGLLAVVVVVPVAEEVVFRGIVLPALRARFRVVAGVALAGAVFAAVHVLPPALPYLLVVGISLCAMAEWYRSIVPGIVLHGANNAIVFAGVLTAGTM